MNNNQPQRGRELTDEEEKEYREGMALLEMDQINPGWAFVKELLQTLAYHSWVDPRETTSEKDWVWKELNAFHAANNAKELLNIVQEKISKADYLGKVKTGEIAVKKPTLR